MENLVELLFKIKNHMVVLKTNTLFDFYGTINKNLIHICILNSTLHVILPISNDLNIVEFIVTRKGEKFLWSSLLLETGTHDSELNYHEFMDNYTNEDYMFNLNLIYDIQVLNELISEIPFKNILSLIRSYKND